MFFQRAAGLSPRGFSVFVHAGQSENRCKKTEFTIEFRGYSICGEHHSTGRGTRMFQLSCRTQSTRTMLLLAVVFVSTALTGCHPGTRRNPYGQSHDGKIRAVWVTRWDYKSPRDISHVMENCRRAGFNTVLFQVRGNGTVLYRSKIEPWADELGGRDPGFDPLAVACKEAHRRGMGIHAWANVMPGWRGDKPPTNPNQLYRKHPDWFWRDESGRRQPLGWYNSLNPCYPEVRRYVTSVMHEIVAKYPVDGLHLDYMRFPNEWNDSYPKGAIVPDYPRDPKTLAFFRRDLGQTPQSAPHLWDKWRTDQVTQLLRDIRKAVKQVDKRIVLSAAVGAMPAESQRRHFQDTQTWLREGLLDALYPMNYAANMVTYRRRVNTWRRMRPTVPVVMGLMFDKRDASVVVEQMKLANQAGAHVAAFAYNSLFERLDDTGRPIMDGQSASRKALRRIMLSRVRKARGRM